MPGGLLAKSLPAPSGWERGGIALPLYGCGEPILRDKCVEAEDVPNRNTVGEFYAVPIEQGSMCSTTGPDPLGQTALDRFTATADWALSRQLQTDQADTGSPKLDDAVSLGAAAGADFTLALGCLEQAAADTGFGATWVVHTTPRGMSYLVGQGLVVDGLTPMGAKVIVGTGYTNPTTTSVPLWATGQVWASISTPESVDAVGYATNQLESWARGVGVAAFDPCTLLLITVTVPVCP
jgi:hypothetical protein